MTALVRLVFAWEAVLGLLTAAEPPSNPLSDPVTFIIGQGVLGVVCFILYREYKASEAKREAQTAKLIDEIVPMLTRATEALERAVTSDDDRKRGGSR